jgi:hypothetical protein
VGDGESVDEDEERAVSFRGEGAVMGKVFAGRRGGFMA